MRLPLTHEEISQLIGASRESVTRSLLQFKRRGIVEIDGSTLTIHSRTALVALAESAPISPEVEVAHDAPQGRRQVQMLRQQLRTARTSRHRTGASFLKLHVDTALTCVGRARQARDLRGLLLGWQGARRTYDTVLRLIDRVYLTDTDAQNLTTSLRRLKSELTSLGRKTTGHLIPTKQI
jgi:hypothetical protein